MGALRTVLEIARQTAALQLQNRLFRLLPLAMLAAAALVFLVGMDPPHSLSGRKLFAVVSWWLLANVLLPWTTMYFGVQAVHGDVEDRTFQYLFLRPVPRWAIFVGKCLAVAGLSALAHAVGKVDATRLKEGCAHCNFLIYVYVNVNYGSILLFYLGQ